MKLTVLVDNNTYIDNYFFGEPGLSFYIEDNDTKILFDTGYSDIFIKNANKLNINLSLINYLVLSHGHNDHTGGLKYLKDKDLSNVKLVSHPNLFDYRSNKGIEIGSPIKLNELIIKEYINGSKAFKITENLYFLGEIKRKFEYENRTIGTLIDGSNDQVIDDSALAYKGKDGIFIITACSHSGICNIIETAKELLKDNKITGIIGGFHLLKNDNQLDETIKYFKNNNIVNLYPCHCVSLEAKIKISQVLKINEVGVGLTIEIE